jgi:hypothetical protein
MRYSLTDIDTARGIAEVETAAPEAVGIVEFYLGITVVGDWGSDEEVRVTAQ